MEGAQQVLAEAMVHSDLAPDGTVGLRHHRGRHVHEPDAPQVTGGGKAGHVANHAAAHHHQHGLAIDAADDQRVVNPTQRRHRLGLLAVGHEDRGELLPVGDAEPVAHGGAVQSPHLRARHHHETGGAGTGLGHDGVE